MRPRTYDMPAVFKRTEPPEAWTTSCARMAEVGGLPWRTLAKVEAAAGGLLDPVLSSVLEGRWDPASWSWKR